MIVFNFAICDAYSLAGAFLLHDFYVFLVVFPRRGVFFMVFVFFWWYSLAGALFFMICVDFLQILMRFGTFRAVFLRIFTFSDVSPCIFTNLSNYEIVIPPSPPSQGFNFIIRGGYFKAWDSSLSVWPSTKGP